MLKKVIINLLSLLIFVSVVNGETKVSSLFCDHMVLQQKSVCPIWGWAMPNEKITITPSWQQSITTITDSNGSWQAQMTTPSAGGPYTIKIKGSREIVISDVLIGEVWLCSGQSNMDMTMNNLNTERSRNDIAQANNNQIRIFDVSNRYSLFEEKDFIPQWTPWRTACSENIGSFSAVAYYFGKRLQEELNVPVGLVLTSLGGTPAESWMDLETIKKFPRFDVAAEIISDVRDKNEDPDIAYGKMMDNWLKKIALDDDGIKNKWFGFDCNEVDWTESQQPTAWSQTPLKDTQGIVWYRKYFNLASANTNMELTLGRVDEIDSVWINENYIGTTFGYEKTRTYRIDAEHLKKGKNIIAVRIINTIGDGGFIGSNSDMKLSSGSQQTDLSGTWKYKVVNANIDLPDPRFASLNSNFPTSLFNAMIAPLIPFRIAGVIWYQGESNVSHPIEYRTLFPAMIKNWRTRWNQGDFPFYYVQIAPFEYGPKCKSQALREAQLLTLAEPNTGMAVTMDISEEKDIHPRNKHDVGDRLARWALNKTYDKKNVVFSGPLYKKMEIEGSSIRIYFEYAHEGLLIKGSELTNFEIAGQDKKFYPAKAIVEGKTVVVSAPQVQSPVAVRYGWSNCAVSNLFNSALLPASSFRTDDWPLE